MSLDIHLTLWHEAHCFVAYKDTETSPHSSENTTETSMLCICCFIVQKVKQFTEEAAVLGHAQSHPSAKRKTKEQVQKSTNRQTQTEFENQQTSATYELELCCSTSASLCLLVSTSCERH